MKYLASQLLLVAASAAVAFAQDQPGAEPTIDPIPTAMPSASADLQKCFDKAFQDWKCKDNKDWECFCKNLFGDANTGGGDNDATVDGPVMNDFMTCLSALGPEAARVAADIQRFGCYNDAATRLGVPFPGASETGNWRTNLPTDSLGTFEGPQPTGAATGSATEDETEATATGAATATDADTDSEGANASGTDAAISAGATGSSASTVSASIFGVMVLGVASLVCLL